MGTKIMDLAIQDVGLVGHLAGMRNANDAAKAARIDVFNAAMGVFDPRPDFANIYVDGKSLPDICRKKYGESFSGSNDQNALMAVEFYDRMISRDSVINFVHPSAENPEVSEVSIIRPEVKPKGFFSRLLSGIKELFGMSGSNKAYNELIEKKGDKYSQRLEEDVELERKAKAKADERDAIQLDVLQTKINRERDLTLNDEAFFGEDTTKGINFGKFRDDESDLGLKDLFADPDDDFGLRHLFSEPEEDNGKSYKDVLNSVLKLASMEAGLKSIGDRVGTRVNFAMLYMLANGCPLETVMSTDEEALREKKRVGRELVDLLLNGDKETVTAKMTEMASKMVQYYANPENYLRFDMTSDMEIAENIKKPEYYVCSRMALDLKQIFLMSPENPYYSDTAKDIVSEEVYDKSLRNLDNFSVATNIIDTQRQGFILSSEYSDAYRFSEDYKELSPDMQKKMMRKVSEEESWSMGLRGTDTAHMLKEKYGNELMDMNDGYIGYVNGEFSERTLAKAYQDATDTTWKKRVENQVLLGEKPHFNEETRKKVIDDFKNIFPAIHARMEESDAMIRERKAEENRTELDDFVAEPQPKMKHAPTAESSPKVHDAPTHRGFV